MSLKRRRTYLLGLFCVFVIVIPLLILFSMGYRLNSKFRLVKTGGIFLDIEKPGVIVKLNGRIVETSNMLGDSILIRNLLPETFYVRVEKEGYKAWRKDIKVEEQKVTICYPFLVQSRIQPEWISKYITEPGSKTKKKRRRNREYSEGLEVFRTYDKPPGNIIPGWEDSDIKKYKPGADRRLKKNVFLFREGNRIYAQWTGSEESRPYFIDTADSKLVYYPVKKIKAFGFFPGRNDSFLVLHKDGTLIAVEIDTRFEIHNAYRIVRKCSRFAVKGETLYFFSEGAMFRIDFGS